MKEYELDINVNLFVVKRCETPNYSGQIRQIKNKRVNLKNRFPMTQKSDFGK